MNGKKIGVYTRNGEDFPLEFVESISAREKATFVKITTDFLFDEDGNYYSVLKNLVFDFVLVAMFTNVDVTDILNIVSDDIYDEMEILLNETMVADIVKMNADVNTINELEMAVDDNIEYRTGIRANPISESISSLLNTIEHKISEIDIDTETMMNMYNMMNGLGGELNMENLIKAYVKSPMFDK